MPLYEYQCQACDTRSEVIQRMSDPPLATCEECGGDLKKLLSAPSFKFKGSGWYVTDYADKGDGKDKAKDSGSEDSGSEDSGSEGSKTKDAPKSESKDSSGGSSSKPADAGGRAERVQADKPPASK